MTVWVIVVFNFFHMYQATLPGTYPDPNACQAALVTTQFSFGNWGQCQPIVYTPTPPVK